MDSSGLVASVAFLEDEKIKGLININYQKTHSQTLLPMLDELLKTLGDGLDDVDFLACANGPGSFTGLRIGVATVKGLGLGLGKKVVEVSTLEALALNWQGVDGVVCPIMDARRSQVYNGLYCFKGSELVTLKDQRALSVEDLAFELNSMNPDQVILLGDGVQVYRERLDTLLTVPHIYAPPSCGRQRAASVASYGAVLFSQGKAIPGSQHAPLYLRKSQAEREREQKGLS